MSFDRLKDARFPPFVVSLSGFPVRGELVEPCGVKNLKTPMFCFLRTVHGSTSSPRTEKLFDKLTANGEALRQAHERKNLAKNSPRTEVRRSYFHVFVIHAIALAFPKIDKAQFLIF